MRAKVPIKPGVIILAPMGAERAIADAVVLYDWDDLGDYCDIIRFTVWNKGEVDITMTIENRASLEAPTFADSPTQVVAAGTVGTMVIGGPDVTHRFWRFLATAADDTDSTVEWTVRVVPRWY